MADLIDRQAAIDAIEAYFGDLPIVVHHDMLQLIKDLPPAQPERKTGRWVHDGYDFPHGNDWIHCSVCGQRGINVPADLSNYCPNCGADMRTPTQVQMDEADDVMMGGNNGKTD